MNKFLSRFSYVYFLSVLISLVNYIVCNLYRKNTYNRLLVEVVDVAKNKTQNYDFFVPELVDRYFSIINMMGSAEATLYFLVLLIVTLLTFLSKSLSKIIILLNIFMSLLILVGFVYIIEATVSFMLYKDIFLSYY